VAVWGIPSRWLLALGVALTTCVVIFNVPGAPLARLHEHRVPAILFAHLAVGLLALGLLPRVPLLVDRFTRASPATQTRDIVTTVAGVAGAMALVALWPSFAEHLLRREWGLVEPAQFVLYLLCAHVCLGHARRLTLEDPRRRLYRLAGWVMVLGALEEIDYLGAVNGLLRLAGVLERGRVGTTYVGSAHDLITLVATYPWLAPIVVGIVGGVTVVVLLAAWRLWPRERAAAWCELWSSTSWPLAAAAACMLIAAWVDVETRRLAAVTGLGRDTVLLIEEPLELLAVPLVAAALLLKVSRDRQDEARGARSRPRG
jgi:hypothetical protein